MARQTYRRIRIRKKKKSRTKSKFIVKKTTVRTVRVSSGKVVTRYYTAKSIKRLTV